MAPLTASALTNYVSMSTVLVTEHTAIPTELAISSLATAIIMLVLTLPLPMEGWPGCVGLGGLVKY